MTAEPCERRDTEWVEKLMAAHDKRYEVRFEAQERALLVAAQNNEHWKAEADEWRKRADEREREFLPRGLGYLLAFINVCIGALGLLLALIIFMKR